LQEPTDEGRLNIVIEAHLINLDTYEITVKTAMRNDSFKISDGQFALEIFENESVLKRMERGKIIEIYRL
jgi:ribosome-binding protein aMBF1 (putative translation factor)